MVRIDLPIELFKKSGGKLIPPLGLFLHITALSDTDTIHVELSPVFTRTTGYNQH
jgi:hypothetical protein